MLIKNRDFGQGVSLFFGKFNQKTKLTFKIPVYSGNSISLLNKNILKNN